jgi:peptidoglycan/xylan/chitin deacetylase (PgdA/CDA1 family)
MKKILLSFDIEEFDMPLEYGKSIPFDDQIKVSAEGTNIILDILLHFNIQATFFSTAVFASHVPELIHRINGEHHELASHSYFHSSFKNQHLLQSKTELERLSGRPIKGFRMPRMMPVDNKELHKAGYIYNASLNPIYLPGRYNNFFKPRTMYRSDEITQLPASVTPLLRLPLFWLSFHNFPLWLYKAACVRVINHDRYLNIYFHPWEFTDLTKEKYGLPSFVSKNSGIKMISRFSDWISWMKKRGYEFSTIENFIASSEYH